MLMLMMLTMSMIRTIPMRMMKSNGSRRRCRREREPHFLLSVACWLVVTLLLNPLQQQKQQQYKGVLLVQAATTANAGLNCPACAFDGLDDSRGCKLYGELLPGSGLIAWSLASPECLQAYDIHTESFDHDVIDRVWTHGWVELPATTTGVAKLIEWLQQPSHQEAETADYGSNSELSSTEVETIRQLQLEFLPHFFQEEESGGRVIFRERVRLGDDTYIECRSADTAQLECWTALREYLSDANLQSSSSSTTSSSGGDNTQKSGVEVLQDIGQALMQQFRRDKEEEQQSVRMELCRRPLVGASSNCGPLQDEVEEEFKDNTSLDCSAFGRGPSQSGHHKELPGHYGAASKDYSYSCDLDEGGGQYGNVQRLPSNSDNKHHRSNAAAVWIVRPFFWDHTTSATCGTSFMIALGVAAVCLVISMTAL